MANNNPGMEFSKGAMMAIIAVLALILLFTYVPGLRALFTKNTSTQGGSGTSTPVNVKVNGQTVPTSGSSGTTKTGSTQGTGSGSGVNVDVNDTKDGTTINIKVPDQVKVDANGTSSTSASVSPVPSL